VTISADQKASIEVGQDPAIQGDNNDFTIQDSPEGNFHAVVIEASDFRTGTTIEQRASTFRNVGDTVQTGIIDTNSNKINNSSEYPGGDIQNSNVTDAFAIVEIDGGTGVGSVETQFLDDSTATIDVFPANGTADSSYLNGNQQLTDTSISNNDLFSNSDDDSQDFEVSQGEVSITSPDTNYVVGSQITLEGDANSGVDEVVIYARDQSDYQRVPIDGENTTQVEGDNTFSETDVVLSNISANNGAGILSIPGSYRLGVVAATDADINGDGFTDASLSTTDFSQGVSSSDSIVVTDTRLDGNFTAYNGQIAENDNAIDVQGIAVGKSSQGVAVVFVGPRGGVATEQISVNNDGSFEEDDVILSGPDDISQGTVTAHILSSGRDQQFGDNVTAADEGVNELLTGGANFGGINELDGTQSQVNARIVANTVDDTGSDDLIVTETFRLADSLTTIESVTSPVETNGTIEVEGQTNKQPDDNTIVVELLDDEDNVIESGNSDQWGTDGVYSTGLELTDVEPGNYTLEVDDGDSTDRAPVVVAENVEEETPTPEPTATEEPTPTATPEPTATPTSTPTATPEPTATPTSTPTGTPGFGIVVALIALVAAALLAVRRNN
jgi:major cell surface glycoprotein (TIGR04216 family)